MLQIESWGVAENTLTLRQPPRKTNLLELHPDLTILKTSSLQIVNYICNVYDLRYVAFLKNAKRIKYETLETKFSDDICFAPLLI